MTAKKPGVARIAGKNILARRPLREYRRCLWFAGGGQDGTARRVIAFMDATGLHVARRYCKALAPFRYTTPPGFDHTLEWCDDMGRVLVTTEPYFGAAARVEQESRLTGWQFIDAPWPGLWNPAPKGGTGLVLAAPLVGGVDLAALAEVLRAAPHMAEVAP